MFPWFTQFTQIHEPVGDCSQQFSLNRLTIWYKNFFLLLCADYNYSYMYSVHLTSFHDKHSWNTNLLCAYVYCRLPGLQFTCTCMHITALLYIKWLFYAIRELEFIMWMKIRVSLTQIHVMSVMIARLQIIMLAQRTASMFV